MVREWVWGFGCVGGFPDVGERALVLLGGGRAGAASRVCQVSGGERVAEEEGVCFLAVFVEGDSSFVGHEPVVEFKLGFGGGALDGGKAVVVVDEF